MKWIFNIGTPNPVAIPTPEQITESIHIAEEANNAISIEHVQATTQQQFRREFDLNEIQRDIDYRRAIESRTYMPQDNTPEYMDVMQNGSVISRIEVPSTQAPIRGNRSRNNYVNIVNFSNGGEIERLAVPSPIQPLRSFITEPQFQVPNMIMGRISPNPQPSITTEQILRNMGYNFQNSMDSQDSLPPLQPVKEEEPLGLSIYQQSIENQNSNEKNNLALNYYDSDDLTV